MLGSVVSSTRANAWVSISLCAGIFVAPSAHEAAAGTLIQITNSSLIDVVLSDLVVYGEMGKSKTFLAPSDTSDDVMVKRGDSKIFDAGFEITKYVVSRTSGSSEFETSIFDVQQLKPKKL